MTAPHAIDVTPLRQYVAVEIQLKRLNELQAALKEQLEQAHTKVTDALLGTDLNGMRVGVWVLSGKLLDLLPVWEVFLTEQEAQARLNRLYDDFVGALTFAGLDGEKITKRIPPDELGLEISPLVTKSIHAKPGFKVFYESANKPQVIATMQALPETADLVKPDVHYQRLQGWANSLPQDPATGQPLLPEPLRKLLTISPDPKVSTYTTKGT